MHVVRIYIPSTADNGARTSTACMRENSSTEHGTIEKPLILAKGGFLVFLENTDMTAIYMGFISEGIINERNER